MNLNWQNIKVSHDNTHFLFNGEPIFGKKFMEVLKFHSPGLAPVQDESGSYHIDATGKELYSNRYTRTFGFYCNRAAIIQSNLWFHITDGGTKAYKHHYCWVGNFQENLCPIRDEDNHYFHINLSGHRIYNSNFAYCGDFKEGIACVKIGNLYRHIDSKGNFINEKSFLDLGVFHKNFATARDEHGWHHINKSGKELYSQRYLMIEPFYNGYALVTDFDMKKSIIDERGHKILDI